MVTRVFEFRNSKVWPVAAWPFEFRNSNRSKLGLEGVFVITKRRLTAKEAQVLAAAAKGLTLDVIAAEVGLKPSSTSYYLSKFRGETPPLIELDYAQTRVEQLRHNSPRVRVWKPTRVGRLALIDSAGIDVRNSPHGEGDMPLRKDIVEVHNIRMKVAVHTNGIKWWPRAPVNLKNGVKRYVHEGFHGVYLEMTAHNDRPLNYIMIGGAQGATFKEAWGAAVLALAGAYEELRKPPPTGYGSVMGTPVVVWDWGPGKSKVGALHLSLTQALAAPPDLDASPRCEEHPNERVFHGSPEVAQAVAELSANAASAAGSAEAARQVAVDISEGTRSMEGATAELRDVLGEFVKHADAREARAAARDEATTQVLRGVSEVLRAMLPPQNGYPPLPPDERVEVA